MSSFSTRVVVELQSTNRRVAMPIGCTTVIVDFLGQAILLSRSRVGQAAHVLPSQVLPILFEAWCITSGSHVGGMSTFVESISTITTTPIS